MRIPTPGTEAQASPGRARTRNPGSRSAEFSTADRAGTLYRTIRSSSSARLRYLRAGMRWSEATFPELGSPVGGTPEVAILPLGAIEAHGPHLPVGTDVWIAEAMAAAGQERLEADGVAASVLPAIAFTPSAFADEFPGTLSVRPETMRLLLLDLGAALARRGVAVFALANSHFDPAQVATLRATAEELRDAGGLRVAFPDLTRRALASRLSEEFRSGACHGGRYETSILLATRPDLVREAARRMLPSMPVSLVEAMRRGEATFGQAGLDLAYCGDPAAATEEEGRALVAELGAILSEAARAELDASRRG